MNATLTRRLAAAALVLAAPVLASCGFDVQTDQVYTPADGVNDRDGMVDVLNALIVVDSDGNGRLVAGLSNNDTDAADELTGVRGEKVDQSVTFTVGDGETQIPAGGYLQLADPGSAAVLATGDRLVPGRFVRLTLTFANADQVTVHVPVFSQQGDYAGVEIPTSKG